MATNNEILVIADNNPNGLMAIVLIALVTFIIVNLICIAISKKRAARLKIIKEKIIRRHEQIENEREMEVNRRNAQNQDICFDR